MNLIGILRTDPENKKCDSRQQPNLISKQKPPFKEKPDKQFLRGKSHCNLMNKSKESKMFGRTQVIDFMDGFMDNFFNRLTSECDKIQNRNFFPFKRKIFLCRQFRQVNI